MTRYQFSLPSYESQQTDTPWRYEYEYEYIVLKYVRLCMRSLHTHMYTHLHQIQKSLETQLSMMYK